MRKFFDPAPARLVAVLAVLLLAGAGAALAQSRGTEAVPTLTFPRGRKTVTVSGSVQQPHGEGDMHNDGADRYLLEYSAGQRVTFDLTSEGNRAVFSIAKVDSDAGGLPVLATRWTGKLPGTGSYRVTVLAREGSARYRLKVTLR